MSKIRKLKFSYSSSCKTVVKLFSFERSPKNGLILVASVHDRILFVSRSANSNGFSVNEVNDDGKAIGTDGCTDAVLHLRRSQHAEQAPASSRSSVGSTLRRRREEHDRSGWRQCHARLQDLLAPG